MSESQSAYSFSDLEDFFRMRNILAGYNDVVTVKKWNIFQYQNNKTKTNKSFLQLELVKKIMNSLILDVSKLNQVATNLK